MINGIWRQYESSEVFIKFFTQPAITQQSRQKPMTTGSAAYLQFMSFFASLLRWFVMKPYSSSS